MDHANNAVYADWLDEAVIAAGDEAATRAVPRRVRLEFAQSAERGATVETSAWRARRRLVVPARRTPTGPSCCARGWSPREPRRPRPSRASGSGSARSSRTTGRGSATSSRSHRSRAGGPPGSPDHLVDEWLEPDDDTTILVIEVDGRVVGSLQCLRGVRRRLSVRVDRPVPRHGPPGPGARAGGDPDRRRGTCSTSAATTA